MLQQSLKVCLFGIIISIMNIPKSVAKELLEQKKRIMEIRDEAYNRVHPLIIDDLKEIRKLTQNIIVVTAAITSFTLSSIDSTLIKTDFFAAIALCLLFITIVYGIHHLGTVLPESLNSRTELLQAYFKLTNERLDQIEKILKTGDTSEYMNWGGGEHLETIKPRDEDKKDHSLVIMERLIIFALILIALSFINFNYFCQRIDISVLLNKF